jgi:rod shape-determining protein MreC
MGRRKRSGASGGLTTFVILLIVCAALFTVYMKEGDSGPLHTVQLGAAEILRPARTAVAEVSQPFKSAEAVVSGAFDRGSNKQEVQRLRQKNQALSARVSTLTQENRRLHQLLKGDQVSYKYAPLARVISPVGGQFTNRVMINVGSREGVKPSQPVITGDNILVGRTAQVSANTSEVILVTDQSFEAGVEIVPEKAGKSGGSAPEGLLKSSYEGYLGVDYIDQSAKVKVGDYVITSGRAGRYRLLFPPGLLVGRVKSVSSQDINQYKKIVVQPAVQPDSLQEVRVITGW